MTGKNGLILAVAILAGGIAAYAVEAWQGIQTQFVSVAYPSMLAFFLVHQACRSWPLAVGAAWLTLHEWLTSLPIEAQWHLIPSMLAFAVAAEAVEAQWRRPRLGMKKFEVRVEHCGRYGGKCGQR